MERNLISKILFNSQDYRIIEEIGENRKRKKRFEKITI